MQCFDDEIEKLIRAGVVDMEMGMSYATNVGNLRLSLADFVEAQGRPGAAHAPRAAAPAAVTPKPAQAMEPDLEIER